MSVHSSIAALGGVAWRPIFVDHHLHHLRKRDRFARRAAMIKHSPSPGASAMMEESPSAEGERDYGNKRSPSPAAAALWPSGTFHKVDAQRPTSSPCFHNADGTFTVTFEDFSIDSAALPLPVLDHGEGRHQGRRRRQDGAGGPRSAQGDLRDAEDFAGPASADAMT